MKYLCLAYGAEKDWHALTKSEQDPLLAQDEVVNLIAQTHARARRARSR